jgi:hypothetical protein
MLVQITNEIEHFEEVAELEHLTELAFRDRLKRSTLNVIHSRATHDRNSIKHL